MRKLKLGYARFPLCQSTFGGVFGRDTNWRHVYINFMAEGSHAKKVWFDILIIQRNVETKRLLK